MHISNMNWQQVESYLEKDDRCILPIGSTEQHAFLSLSTDSLLAEKMAIDVAAPLGIPVFPVISYGVTPLFMAFPGTVSLQPGTLFLLVRDVLDSLMHHGFRRILIVNGHGGNIPLADELHEHYKGSALLLQFHNWWKAPVTWKQVMDTDPVASHASWMENFPWTRLDHIAMPVSQKQMTNLEKLKLLTPVQAREVLGDGNYGGNYQRADNEMMQLWETAVLETRSLLDVTWK